MRHHNANRKFGRVRKVRNALMKSLALSLILQESITTTEAKAKELRPEVEKLITIGKKGHAAKKDPKVALISATRLLVSRIGSIEGAEKVVKTLAPKYASTSGGYTRIIKLPIRVRDGSKMAYIEFI